MTILATIFLACDVVDYSSVPLVLTRLDLHEAIVVSTLYYCVVHRKRLVEEDVVDVLWDGVFPQSHRLLHSFEVVRIGDELVQTHGEGYSDTGPGEERSGGRQGAHRKVAQGLEEIGS